MNEELLKKLEIKKQRKELIAKSYANLFFGYTFGGLLVNIDDKLKSDESKFINQREIENPNDFYDYEKQIELEFEDENDQRNENRNCSSFFLTTNLI